MRPVTATCTALRIFSIAPRGSGRTGSIQPWANAGRAIAHSAAASPGRRFRDSMGLVPVRDAMVPITMEEGAGMLIFTLAGRGVMLLDGDRIEVAANDLVHIPAGVSYGLQTLGGTDWTYVVLQAPLE